MNQDPKIVFLSDRQVSQQLGMSRQTLANWRHLGRGPRFVKAGRLIRYAMNDLLAFMEARKIGTQDQPKDQR
jgi:predicted DNA-binding transcriptional regulator AlpA